MTLPATDHLSRLLAMVPYLLDHQGIGLSDAAARFDITEDELVDDLQLLFLCGTPGHMPDDLIEADWESGHVYLGNADELSKPVRLSMDEALTLIVGLRMLADVPGLAGKDAVDSALAKLVEATGGLSAARTIGVDAAEAGSADVLATLQRALGATRRVHISYLVPARDEVTERDVDPMTLTSTDGHWYFEGWCHRAADVRLFRTDRITAAELLDIDGTPPERAEPKDLSTGIFVPASTDTAVTMELEPEAGWIAEYYPTDEDVDLGNGRRRIVLRTADTGWLRRLLPRLGGAATVIEPAEIQDGAVEAARSALNRYRELG
ncbi:helix-turn-helix transcriptional regulator [Spelaeicoccus albus]|uniref:Proteasome accessory factor C n=1 Tax=Spelaeicoccus albus TaxID=1280376 RepID=A0A7Z0III8_9MICO|nr:WYL domain-containing protein [Spelaeicoccus albus]NYI68407.1 proteasome accessory factor C [Spelaeicoccus albus]